MRKQRLDRLLVHRGLAGDTKEAVALIMRGAIKVDGRIQDKAGTLFGADVTIELTEFRPRYVSRGGLKLEVALKFFALDVHDWVCLDLGSSTGGFTDCLLQAGAKKVFAFDVGRGQLDWGLRNDPRVTVKEGFNVRFLSPGCVGESVHLIVADLSFISLRLVLPSLKDFLDARFLMLVKPQFEAEAKEVEVGGLITDPVKRQEILSRVQAFAVDLGFRALGHMQSPIRGQKGNYEFFLYLER